MVYVLANKFCLNSKCNILRWNWDQGLKQSIIIIHDECNDVKGTAEPEHVMMSIFSICFDSS